MKEAQIQLKMKNSDISEIFISLERMREGLRKVAEKDTSEDVNNWI